MRPNFARKPSLIASFTRSQFSSGIATVCDFGTLAFLVEIAGWWYVLATASGAFVGAVVNFTLGRYWSFQAIHGRVHQQAFRYAVVSFISLVLNSAGVYLFTDHLGLPYMVSKSVTSLIVGICFNFPMHRNFVFR